MSGSWLIRSNSYYLKPEKEVIETKHQVMLKEYYGIYHNNNLLIKFYGTNTFKNTEIVNKFMKLIDKLNLKNLNDSNNVCNLNNIASLLNKKKKKLFSK